jgi:hypothetical protein
MECVLFFKVEDLISAAEKESFNLKQKVTFHVIMSVLTSCCTSSRETHFPFAVRVFSLLQKTVKKLESVITAVVRSAACRELNIEGRGVWGCCEVASRAGVLSQYPSGFAENLIGL